MTWFQPKAGITWDNPGGDFNTTAVCQIESRPDATNSWEEYAVTGAIKEFHSDSSKNNGLLLLYQSTNRQDYYASGYETDKTLRPKLTVTYVANTAIKWHVKQSSPVSDGIVIRYNAHTIDFTAARHQFYTATLYTLSGKAIFNQSWMGTHHSLQVNTASRGVFILRITGRAATAAEFLLVLDD